MSVGPRRWWAWWGQARANLRSEWYHLQSQEISCSLLLQLQPVICLTNCRTDRKLLPRPAKTSLSNFQMYFEELSRSGNEVKITSTSFSLSIIYGGGRQTKNFTRFQFCGRPPPVHLHSRLLQYCTASNISEGGIISWSYVDNQSYQSYHPLTALVASLVCFASFTGVLSLLW